jgi:iron complex transport system substrate-binding protein
VENCYACHFAKEVVMKKRIFVIALLVAIVLSQGYFLPVTKAASYKPAAEIQLVVNYPVMNVDGINLVIDPGRNTSPVIVKEWGRTVVPIRGIIEAIGGNVVWNNETRKVSIELNNSDVELTIGNSEAIVNGKEVWIDENHSVKPVIINSRTMVPLRFVAESLGGTIDYDEKTMKMLITLDKQLFQTKDMLGNDVTIPKKVYKVVSLDPMATQLIFAVGGQDLLVSARFGPAIKGPALVKIYPRSAQIKDPGTADTASVEYLLSVKPDLIVAVDGKMVEQMREVGLPVYLLDRESPENVLKSISILGTLLGKTDNAEEINSYFEDKLTYIQQTTSALQDKKVKVYVSGSSLLSTFGKDYFQTFMIENAGGVSVSSSTIGGKIDISLEQLLAWNPDVIILTSYTPDSVQSVLSNPSLAVLKAVKDKRVYKLPTYIVSWDTPVPESFLGTMWIANKLYPKELSFDMVKEIKEFYLKVYNFNIPDDDLNKLIDP